MNERIFIVVRPTESDNASYVVADGETKVFTNIEAATQYAELIDGTIVIKDLETELDLSEWN